MNAFIHDVKRIEVTNIRTLNDKKIGPIYCRDIKIKTEDSELEFTLEGPKKNLNFINKKN